MARKKSVATLNDQGGITVARDQHGKPIAKSLEPDKKVAWREILGKVTNNGIDLLARMHCIANGEPFVPVGVDRDGRAYSPMVPTIEQQLHAQQMLWEYLHGKAVAQTEVVKASEAANEMDRLRAMSDAELQQLIHKKRLTFQGTDETGHKVEGDD